MISIDEHLAALGITPIGSLAFQPISVNEIETVRRTIGSQLPKAYERFLVRYGSCMFSGGVSGASSIKPVNYCCFFGFEELVTAIDSLKETLPETIIPIGDDSGDIVICLGVSEPDVGKIYIHHNGIGWRADAERYLERGEQVPSGIRYQTVHQVALSFEEFIKNMN